MDQRYVTGKKLASSPPARGASGQGRLDFLYHDQGSSSYEVKSYYEPDERARYLNHGLDGPSRFENLENCRAELLRKLDELKDHLSRSCEVAEKPGRRMGSDMMISPALDEIYPRNHAAYVQEGSTSSHGVNKQPLSTGGAAHPYLNQTPGFVPYNHTYRSSLRDLHLHRGYPPEFLSYPDTYQQEMPHGPYGQSQSQYLHQHYHELSDGYYGNVNHGLFVSDREFHKHNCTCVLCFDKNWDLPVNSSGFHNQRSQHALSNPNYLRYKLPVGHGPQGFSSGSFTLHTSNSQQSITPNSTEQDLGNDGIHFQKTAVAHRNGHILYPVAGGAPFITCSSCFESLKLPRKHISLAKRQHKLKCGACSSIILFELENKALTVPISGSLEHVVTEMDNYTSVTVNANVGYQQGRSDFADPDAGSDPKADSLPEVSPADNRSNSGELEKQLDPLSASSLSDNLPKPYALTPEKHSSSSEELHAAEAESFPLPILAAENCPDHSVNVVVDQYDSGNKGTKSELDGNVSWQNSVRDSAVSTEIDISSKEFPNSSLSLNSVDERKERLLRDEKDAESSPAGHNKSNSVELLKLAENLEVGSSQVYVNWHLIPEHLVQKAELLAGPIQPGDYWYDIRAGFWGVMGYPCLGIIMPNIEEFNYPMPVNCAAGNTGVFVNGRELHQKDLELLAGRGLPATRERSYLVEISGEVVDADTGEELDNIGRLAPTVERARHGFGMKVPRFIARLQG